VCDDAMAMEYNTYTTLVPSEAPCSQPAFSPSANVSLLACQSTHNKSRHNTLNSSIFISMEQNIAHIFRQPKNWKSDVVWNNNIDMQSLGISFKSGPNTPSCHFMSKMLHGWQNTGHQCAKITKDPLSSLCPCCKAPNETSKHMLQCTALTVEAVQTEVLKRLVNLTNVAPLPGKFFIRQ
jgi:hypothetical protein